MAKRAPQNQEKYIVRFPDGMRDEIKRSADLHGRSLNAEIIQRIKQAYTVYDDGRFSLILPEDVRDALLVDALAHGKTEDERASEILSMAYNPEGDYSLLLDRIAQQFSEIGDLRERNDDLKARLERDFVLYYNKATQLNQFARLVLASTDSELPSHVRSSAEALQALTDIEMVTLRERYEDGLFWVSRRDLEIENARDAANEGKHAEARDLDANNDD